LSNRISGSLRNRGRGRPAIKQQNVGLSPSETNRDLLKRLFPDLEEQRVAHLREYEEEQEEEEARRRIEELKNAELWLSHEEIRNLSKKPEPNVHVEQFQKSQHWSRLLQEVTKMGEHWKIERKYRRILNKKIAGKVRTQVREQQEKLDDLERIASNKQKNLAKEVSKMVQKEFWNKVEKVALLFHEKREEKEQKKQMDEDLNDIVNKTELFSKKMADQAFSRNRHDSGSSPASSRTASRCESRKNSDSEDDFEIQNDQSDNESTIESDEDCPEENELQDLNDETDADISKILEKLYGLKGITPLHENQPKTEPKTQTRNRNSPKPDQKPIMNGGSSGKVQNGEKLEFQPPPNKIAKADDNSQSPDKMSDKIPDKKSTDQNDKLDNLTSQAASMLPVGLTLSENHVSTTIPDLLRGKLRDYQHIGLDWLVGLFDQNLNGILADEMGLGKTIQTISLLAHLACHVQNWGPHLIIVPTSVLLNWDLEFKKWLPGFKVITYYGSQKERKERRKGWSAQNAFNVCVTSYNLAIQDQRVFKRLKWKYIILDEAHNIKNWMSQRWQTLLQFKSQNRLLLTGTPLQESFSGSLIG